MHADNVVVLQPSQSLGLLHKLRALAVESSLIVGHADGDRLAVTKVYLFHKELLQGISLVEVHVGHYISIAEAARTERTFYPVGAASEHGSRL